MQKLPMRDEKMVPDQPQCRWTKVSCKGPVPLGAHTSRWRVPAAQPSPLLTSPMEKLPMREANMADITVPPCGRRGRRWGFVSVVWRQAVCSVDRDHCQTGRQHKQEGGETQQIRVAYYPICRSGNSQGGMAGRLNNECRLHHSRPCLAPAP